MKLRQIEFKNISKLKVIQSVSSSTIVQIPAQIIKKHLNE